jgi:hypothetical protein
MLMMVAFGGAAPKPPAGLPARGLGMLRGAATALAAVLAVALAEHLASRLLNSAAYPGGYHLYRAFTLDALGTGLLALGAVLSVYASAARGRGAVLLAILAVLAGVGSSIHGFDPLGLGVGGGLALLCAVFRGRRLDLWGSWLGALLLLLLLAIPVQATAPLASPLIVWPLLAGALGAAIWAWVRRIAPLSGVLYPATLAVAMGGIVGSLAAAIFVAVGPVRPEVLSVFALLYLASFAPFVEAASRQGRPGLIAGVVLGLGVCALLSVGYGVGTAERPQLTQAFYVADGADGPQVRIAPLAALDPWATQTLKADGGLIHRAALPPFAPAPVWMAPARHRPLTPPQVRLEQHGAKVTLQATVSGGGRVLYLYLRSPSPMQIDAVNDAAVGVAIKPNTWGVLDYSAPPPKGVKLQVSAALHAKIDAVAIEQRDGWPTGAAPPAKPPQLMAWRNSDTTLVMARASVGGLKPSTP